MKKTISAGNILPPPRNVFGIFSVSRKIFLLLTLTVLLHSATQAQCPIINITSNTTWNFNQTINGEVHVYPPATLTITGNFTTQFANSCSGIVVEVGGNLVISNNARLTKASGNFLWKGIDVKAQPTNVINLQYCYIEYAQVGVKLRSGIYSANDYAASLFGLYVVFRNNQISISKTGHSTQSTSNIELHSCAFKTESDYAAVTQNPVIGVELIYTDLVEIEGGYFQNSTNGALWTRGVVINGNSFRPVNIHGPEFRKIEKGIYIEGSTVIHTVQDCYFDIPTPAFIYSGGGYSSVYGDTYGVMAVASKVKIGGLPNADKNVFIGVQRDMANPKRAYGVVIDNTGAGGVMVNTNDFSGMDVGFQSQLNNIQAVVSCNSFNGFQPSMTVNKRYSWITLGGSGAFMRNQGLLDIGNVALCLTNATQAGNEWSSLCSGSSHDVDIRVTNGLAFYYASHAVSGSPQQSFPNPDCSTTAWKTSYLKVCAQGTNGYTKGATSCNAPFAYPPGFNKNEESLDISVFDEPEDYFDAAANYISNLNISGNGADSEQQLNELFYYRGAMQWASNEVVAKLLQASDDQGALDWLSKSPLAEDAKALCVLQLTKGNFSAAILAADDFVQKVSGSIHESKEFSDYYTADATQFVSLIGLVADILQRGEELKEEEKAALEEFHKLTSETGVWANNFIRQLTGKADYYEPIYAPDDEVGYKVNLNAETASPVHAYPIPSNGNFTIEYDLGEQTSEAELVVTEMTGIEIFRLNLSSESTRAELNISHYTPGIYFFSILENNKKTYTGKLILMN